jgi:hypothetical protein
MPDSTIDRLFLMLEAQSKLASAERAQLTAAFERQLTGLRWELRGIAVTAAIVVLAASGVGVKLLAPGMSVETSPDASTVSVVVDPATPADAEPAPYVPNPADADHAPVGE